MFSLDDVKKYLEDADWRFRVVGEPENSFIRTGIKGENGTFEITIMVSSDPPVVVFRIYDFAKIGNMALDKKGKLLDLINQYNHNNLFGKVYIDDDNELTFSYAIPLVGDTELDRESFIGVLYLSANFVDEMYPSIMKLVWS
jgi:hypothetical protein